MVLADVLAIVGMHECIRNCMFFYVVDSVTHNALVRDVSFKIITWYDTTKLPGTTTQATCFGTPITAPNAILGLRKHVIHGFI